MRRAGSSGKPPELCIGLVLLLNILCLSGGALLTASSNESTASAKTASWCTSLAYTLFAGAALATLALDCLCPEPAHSNGSSSSNGHNGHSNGSSSSSSASFKMPLLPYLPAVGILIGSVLLAQVSAPSLKDSAISFVLVLALYGLYGASRSVGNRTHWGKHSGESRGLLEGKYSAQQDPGYYSFESTGSLR
jgi:cytochrome bd-type quinol oxidase subunit 2